MILIPAESAGSTDFRKFDITHIMSIQRILLNLSLRVLQIRRQKTAAYDVHIGQCVASLSNNLPPRIPLRTLQIDSDDTTSRRIPIALEVQQCFVIADEGVFVVKIIDQIVRCLLGPRQVIDDDPIAIVSAFPDSQNQIMPIL